MAATKDAKAVAEETHAKISAQLALLECKLKKSEEIISSSQLKLSNLRQESMVLERTARLKPQGRLFTWGQDRQIRSESTKAWKMLGPLQIAIDEEETYLKNALSAKNQLEKDIVKIRSSVADQNNKLTELQQEILVWEDLSPLLYELNQTTLSIEHIHSYPKLVYDQTAKELNQNDHVVAGCGLNLINREIGIDSALAEIANVVNYDLPNTCENKWLSIEAGRENSKGYVFKLNFSDFPAASNKDYGWMEFLKVRDDRFICEWHADFIASILNGEEANTENLVANCPFNIKEAIGLKDCHGASAIHYAAATPSLRILEFVFENGASLASQDQAGYTPLHHAARAGMLVNAKWLLSKCPDLLNQLSYNRSSPLFEAVSHNKPDLVEYLITRGADVNARAAYDMSPLFCAVHNGFKHVLDILLSCSQIQVDCAIEDGTTPLFLAVSSNDAQTVEKLIKKRANPLKERLDSFTPLHLAAQSGTLKICQLILDYPMINVDKPLKSGRTALQLAAALNPNPEIVSLLLNQRANPSWIGWHEETALLSAILNGNVKAALSIIAYCTRYSQHRASLSRPDLNGDTPLLAAANCGSQIVIEALLDSGVVVDDPNNFLDELCKGGVDPFYLQDFISKHRFSKALLTAAYESAVLRGHTELMSLFSAVYGLGDFVLRNGSTLIENAARLDHTSILQRYAQSEPSELFKLSKDKRTPAAIAAEYGRLPSLELLLEAMDEEQVTLSDQYYGKHLLVAAIMGKDLKAIDLILCRVKDANIIVDREGLTASHYAARFGDLETLTFLRTKGADFNRRDNRNQTVFDYGFLQGHQNLVDYFLDSGNEFQIPPCLLYRIAKIASGSMIKRLIEQGFNPNDDSNQDRETAIFNAIRHNNLESALALRNGGASLDVKCAKGDTPLTLAVKLGKTQFIPHFLRNADIKSPEYKGLLHLAAENGREAIVEILLQHGYHPNQLDGQGKPAAFYAKQGGFANIEMLLSGKIQELGHIKQKLVAALERLDVKGFIKLASKIPSTECMVFELRGQRVDLPLTHLATFMKDDKLARMCASELLSMIPAVAKAKEANEWRLQHRFAHHGYEIDFQGADLSISDDKGKSALHFYAVYGTKAIINKALTHWKSLELTDDNYNTPLCDAILANRVDNVRCLLSHGANPNHWNKKRETPLLMAVRQNNAELVKILLSNNAEINRPCRNHHATCLAIAIGSKLFDMAHLLIESGACVIQRDFNGVAPVHLAAAQGHTPLLQILLVRGASLQAVDYSGKGVVHYAAMSDNPGLITSLKNKGLPVHIDEPSDNMAELAYSPPNSTGLQPFHLAAAKGNREMLEILFQKGCNVEAKTEAGISALVPAAASGSKHALQYLSSFKLIKDEKQKLYAMQAAIANDHIRQLKLLLPDGSSPNAYIDSYRRSLLHHAAIMGAPRCAHYLVDAGADLNARDFDQATPLEYTITNSQLAMTRFLCQQLDVSEVNELTTQGGTYLHLACEMQNSEIAAILLESGASPDALNVEGLSSIEIVIRNQNLELLQLLLACGAEIEPPLPDSVMNTTSGSTKAKDLSQLIRRYYQTRADIAPSEGSPLHLAVLMKDYRNMPLLSRAQDIDYQDKNGLSALHLAVINGDLKAVQLLKRHGANINLPGLSQDDTPLSRTIFAKQVEIVEYLLKIGASSQLLNSQNVSLLECIAKEPVNNDTSAMLRLMLKYLPQSNSDDLTNRLSGAVTADNTHAFWGCINEGYPILLNLPYVKSLASEHHSKHILDTLRSWLI